MNELFKIPANRKEEEKQDILYWFSKIPRDAEGKSLISGEDFYKLKNILNSAIGEDIL